MMTFVRQITFGHRVCLAWSGLATTYVVRFHSSLEMLGKGRHAARRPATSGRRLPRAREARPRRGREARGNRRPVRGASRSPRSGLPQPRRPRGSPRPLRFRTHTLGEETGRQDAWVVFSGSQPELPLRGSASRPCRFPSPGFFSRQAHAPEE